MPKRGFIIAVYGARGGRVVLVFQDGRLLDHPLLTDDGKVKKVRWIPFAPGDDAADRRDRDPDRRGSVALRS